MVIVVVSGLLLWGRIAPELVSLLGLFAVVIGGVVTPQQAMDSFAHPAVVTVAGMFVLSHGLVRTGAVDMMGARLSSWSLTSASSVLWVVLPAVLVLSAFLNNTPVVALFVPLMVRLAKRVKVAPSRLLMPLSFAAMLGGGCTLIGTSTNLVVSGILEERGLRPMGMFEVGRVGLPLALIGLAYLLWVAPRILPNRPQLSTEVAFPQREYVSEVVIRDGSPLVGSTLASSAVGNADEVSVLEVIRDGEMLLDPLDQLVMQVGDRLVLTAPPADLRTVHELNGVEYTQPGLGVELVAPHAAQMVEGMVAPGSALVGKTIGELGLRHRYGMTVLAIHRHSANIVGRLRGIKLSVGDLLLMFGTRESHDRIVQSGEFIVLDDVPHDPPRKQRIPIALATLLGVVIVAGLGLAPLMLTVLVGCVVVVLTGCIDANDAYRAIEWEIVLLIVGMLALGTALTESGAAFWISDTFLGPLAGYGPRAVLAGIYLLTAVASAFLSNSAAAALLAPIAIQASLDLGVDPRPMVFAVAVGASAAFSTPIGYQTNLLVYGPGGYRFGDFVRVGLPLNLLLAVFSIWLLPLIWSF